MSCGLLVRRTTNRQSTRSIVRADGRRPSGDGIAPLLIEQGSGHILNAASAGGLMPLPTITPYNATMPAAVGLTETLNVELRAVPPSPSPVWARRCRVRAVWPPVSARTPGLSSRRPALRRPAIRKHRRIGPRPGRIGRSDLYRHRSRGCAYRGRRRRRARGSSAARFCTERSDSGRATLKQRRNRQPSGVQSGDDIVAEPVDRVRVGAVVESYDRKLAPSVGLRRERRRQLLRCSDHWHTPTRFGHPPAVRSAALAQYRLSPTTPSSS
ncbi:SDR family oxidoreductase [Williamsia sp. DF01-3]|uniref:SDR family oxidoreductase n=1 Tax=Williamsia sp. DF01-3 TaxID=2934157 RepID=UPI001FF63EFF|nr:SDR family oxidoreductase [Williamsia sp. DF01-3]MCK0516787.1 SDR family NAD(P)-dependent oxidoreductase [Williamsia sp. DF01-3]